MFCIIALIGFICFALRMLVLLLKGVVKIFPALMLIFWLFVLLSLYYSHAH